MVTDDNGEISLCQNDSPFTSSCVDDRSEYQPTGAGWVELKINRAPTVGIQNTPNLTDGGTRVIRRATDIEFSPTAATYDPDGTIDAYEWTVERIGGGETGLAPTNLNVESPTLRFEPIAPTDQEYQVRVTLRVTDDNGGFTTTSTTYSIRNSPPVPGITVRNSQTEAIHGVPNYPVWTSADPSTEPATFRFDAGAAQDRDGTVVSRIWEVYRVNGSGDFNAAVPPADKNPDG